MKGAWKLTRNEDIVPSDEVETPFLSVDVEAGKSSKTDKRIGVRVKPASERVPAPPTPKPAGMVEVAPNKFVQMDLNFGAPPETVICDVVPIPGHPGAFKLVPHSWEQLERVTVALCRKLGLGGSTTTLRRLIRTGFVDGSPVSPEVYNVNLASFFAHMKRCAEDPDFWQNPKVKEQFRSAY